VLNVASRDRSRFAQCNKMLFWPRVMGCIRFLGRTDLGQI